MKKFVALSFIFFLVACGTSEEVIIQPEVKEPLKAVIGEFKEADPVAIKGARIEGNVLSLDIEYTGGCSEHGFELIGSPFVMKSMPPKRTVQLVHDKKGDFCKELINETIEFDIKALAYKQEAGDQITLLVEGIKEGINYTFK